MNVWTYIKGVITDTSGGLESISLGLERNPGAVVELGAENPPDVPLFLLRVDLAGGFAARPPRIPVYRHENPASHPILKEIYHCEVAGKRLEAANVYSLRAKVQRQLEAIAPSRALPLCYFRARRFDYSLPVYRDGSRLVCPVLAGPKIRAAGLTEIREPVIRHMHTAGYLEAGEEAEVLVVRPSDLRLVSPAAVIRSLDDPSLWLPAVEGASEEGPVVGLLAHVEALRTSERRRRGLRAVDVPPSGPDVSALLRYLAHELSIRGHLDDPWALYAADVRPEIWARTEELTDATDRQLECHLEGELDGAESLQVPVLHTAAGEHVAALEDEGIVVFLAGDQDALASCVGRYLVARGFLRHAEDLRTEVRRARPVESLDPDSIWDGGPSAFADFGAPPIEGHEPALEALASEGESSPTEPSSGEGEKSKDREVNKS